ncbi:hypothetical protein VM1G_07985 [Cytospora mali]|uniref:SprT-like domain-containing protein n=1 Tax=Cytospora mali TaxID=578113 RepID=A0A194W709_CYTMA|nr:hypothetical protein VM1G_07985 [Valsa mali]
MARQARTRRIINDSSDDEFPDIRQIGSFRTKGPKDARPPPAKQAEEPTSKGIVRIRKLGSISDNVLLRPATERSFSGTIFDDDDNETRRARSTKPQRIELRTRKSKPVVKNLEIEDFSESDSVQEETIIEDFLDDEESDFEASQSSNSEGEKSTSGLSLERSPPRSFSGSGGDSKTRKISSERERSPSPSAQLLAEAFEARGRHETQISSSREGSNSRRKTAPERYEEERSRMPTDLARPLTKFKKHALQPRKSETSSHTKRPTTPDSPAPESRYKGLASPSKRIPRIPTTPHHPQTDTFWSQEFIDDWNDEHSPKKQLFLPSANQTSPKKSPSKKGPSQAAVARAAKKAFEQSKHDLADTFLRDLDEHITENKISELSASTGGIRIDWSNRLNTTAGRANWKRETTRRKDAETGAVTSTSYKHHASIELAEKVIDDEHRLLNVIAHEFCHLANFMISGVTTNPHGKEFKAWAAKVTRVFGDRGIEVTTKHSYDIDFKYVWECTTCGLEFKRHSKSINTERHRCGACKSELKQTKPVPRAKPGKESEYQKFMKEQMKVIKQENPGCPQKDIMKLVASRWSQKEKESGEPGDPRLSNTSLSTSSSQQTVSGGKKRVETVRKSLNQLTLIDLT